MPCQHVAGHRGLIAHKGHHWWHWRSTTHRGYLAQLHNHHLVTSLLAICRSPCHKGSRPRQMAPMSAGDLHDQNNFQHSLQMTTSTANRQAPRTPRRAPKHIELALKEWVKPRDWPTGSGTPHPCPRRKHSPAHARQQTNQQGCAYSFTVVLTATASPNPACNMHPLPRMLCCSSRYEVCVHATQRSCWGSSTDAIVLRCTAGQSCKFTREQCNHAARLPCRPTG